AVTTITRWTYTLRPSLVLKELYVRESARKSGVGRELMAAVMREATSIDAHRVVWSVLANNHAAQRFYESLGARHDPAWQNWRITLGAGPGAG
ncbi:MAG: GNAT family N-acetyltransferase, partial [Myxococcota bacterium]